ncbi:MAG: hypothetical protein Q9195_003311 [Heterodermia aff. obscurata]
MVVCMSPTSSPARSSAGSAASSSSDSPGNSPPQQLTPRSKIKALVAAFDSDSDQEQANHVEKPVRQLEDRANNTDRRSIDHSDSSSVESESSIREPARAKGTLAARLQRKRPIDEVSHRSPTIPRAPQDEDAEKTGNAYERVRRWVLPKSSPGNQQTSLNQGGGDSVDDDEDRGPVVPRRRRRADHLIGESDTTKSHIATPTRSRKSSSPGLFLTTPEGDSMDKSPSKAAVVNDDSGSDSDLPTNPQTNERFAALVARKRAERKAKEAAEEEKRAAREAQYMQQARSRQSVGDSEDDSDELAARKLTQQTRPTRKASKKALEEMSRETQRMNRNMQLAHQARTNKKITKASLLARFNFRTTDAPAEQQAQVSSTVVSSAPVSETEAVQHQATSPPSSPPAPSQDPSKPHKQDSAAVALDMDTPAAVFSDDEDAEEALPSLDDVLNEPRPTSSSKGKSKAVELPAPKKAPVSNKNPTIKITFPPKIKTTRSKTHKQEGGYSSESDDLEILAPAPQKNKASSRLTVFDRFPAGKQRSLHALRTMAHLPEKRSSSMTASEMHLSLQQRARKQAAAERAEKIQGLKDRGIIVQTAEERQRDQAEVQDLLERARQEADGIKKKEKEAAKRAAKRNGEEFNDSSDDEDEDYEEYQGNEADDESEIELSGSEDEEAAAVGQQGSGDEPDEDAVAEDDEEVDEVSMDDEEDEVNTGDHSNQLIENEAMEDSSAEDTSSSTGEIDIDTDQPHRKKPRIKRLVIEDDDEEEEEEEEEPNPIQDRALETPSKPLIPKIALGTSPGLMGMTQAFAATLAESQTQEDVEMDTTEEQDSMSFLGPVPEPNILPVYDTTESMMVPDSQTGSNNANTGVDTNAINLDFNTQSQMEYEPYYPTEDLTQDTEMPEPTQDMGFHLSSPAGNRFVSVPPSTVDTVLLPGQSPVKKKKGRLQRGRRESTGLSDADEETPVSPRQSADFDISANAFDVMKQKRSAAVKTAQAFDKTKSKAKELVEEQALESEDEYAGLGGASDESSAEEDEDLQKMMEEGEVEVDERKLAAFYAEKERAADELAISKLHRDINNGGLRRNKGVGGADFDLSDSDDDAEARHRAKRREHAKMRKLLFSDEKLSKIVDNPKKMAFLRAIEDREDEDLGTAWDILATPEETVDHPQSKPASNDTTTSGSKRKRPLQESLPDAANRPPPSERRTKPLRKPATLAEIRESVSFLIETPESMSFQSHADSSSDLEAPAETELMPPPPRRARAPVIDRLSLKRAATADQSTGSTRLAFAAPNTLDATESSFRVPALLRRASTSNLLTQSDNNHGITTLAATEQTAGGADGKEGFVRKGGRKGSSILAQARQMERRAVLDGVEKRRQAERERIAKCRRERGFLGGNGGGWEA